jgi:hypothetical protein
MDDQQEPFKLPSDWVLKKSWGDWALEERKTWKEADVKKAAKEFHRWHLLKGDTRKSWGEWQLAWEYWVKNRQSKMTHAEEKPSQGWKCNTEGCNKPGSMAHQGGGPWYCSEHFLFNPRGAEPCLF